MKLNTAQIARVCHEANRSLQASFGEDVNPPWAEATDWMRESSIAGVEAIIDGRSHSPEDQHRLWMSDRLAAGWTLGPVKDTQEKISPCLIPYEELPEHQRLKDAVFFAIVKSLSRDIPPSRIVEDVDEPSVLGAGVGETGQLAPTPIQEMTREVIADMQDREEAMRGTVDAVTPAESEPKPSKRSAGKHK